MKKGNESHFGLEAALRKQNGYIIRSTHISKTKIVLKDRGYFEAAYKPTELSGESPHAVMKRALGRRRVSVNIFYL